MSNVVIIKCVISVDVLPNPFFKQLVLKTLVVGASLMFFGKVLFTVCYT